MWLLVFFASLSGWCGIQSGTGVHGEGWRVTFHEPFRLPPVVVVSGHWNGRAVVASASSISRAGFILRLRDLAGNPIKSGVWVQWVASTGWHGVQVGRATCNHGDRIRFPAALPGRTILTSAQRSGVPYLVCALDNSPTGFTVAVTAADGSPGRGVAVQWIAVAPGPQWRCGVAQFSDGRQATFPAMSATPVILTSAQQGQSAVAVAALNSSNTGCQLSIQRAAWGAQGQLWGGAGVQNATVQLWALPGGIVAGSIQGVGVIQPPDTPQPPSVVVPPPVVRPPPGAVVNIQSGVAACGDGQRVKFHRAFRSTPAIVVSGQRNGRAVVVGPSTVTRTGFRVWVRDVSGRRVNSGVWVQWVAATNGGGVRVGDARCSHGGRVRFRSPLPGRVILTSGERSEMPYCVGALESSSTGFRVAVTSAEGSPGRNVAVQWIAVAPSNRWRCGAAQLSDGEQITFPAMASTPVLLASAQQGGSGVAIAAFNNSRSGCRLSIHRPMRRRAGRRPDTRVQNAMAQLWAVPAGVVWSGAQRPGATQPPPGPAHDVQSGTGRYQNGQLVKFARPFPSRPVVMCYALEPDREVEATAILVSRTGFALRIRDARGRRAVARVRWVAGTEEAYRAGRMTPGARERPERPPSHRWPRDVDEWQRYWDMIRGMIGKERKD